VVHKVRVPTPEKIADLAPEPHVVVRARRKAIDQQDEAITGARYSAHVVKPMRGGVFEKPNFFNAGLESSTESLVASWELAYRAVLKVAELENRDENSSNIAIIQVGQTSDQGAALPRPL